VRAATPSPPASFAPTPACSADASGTYENASLSPAAATADPACCTPHTTNFWSLVPSASTADTGRAEAHSGTMHAMSENPGPAEAAAATGGSGSPGSWAETYKQERYLHTVCAMLAVRAELMLFLDNMPSLVRSFIPVYAPDYTQSTSSTLRLYYHIIDGIRPDTGPWLWSPAISAACAGTTALNRQNFKCDVQAVVMHVLCPATMLTCCCCWKERESFPDADVPEASSACPCSV
jgi:hypothetical protein